MFMLVLVLETLAQELEGAQSPGAAEPGIDPVEAGSREVY
jgi:hypothetical protein